MKIQAQLEFNELIKWANAEEEKVRTKLKAAGIVRGLDGNTKEYTYIREEECKRLKEMAEKYNLPNLKKIADKKVEIYKLKR